MTAQTFNLEYIITVIVALITAFLLRQTQMNLPVPVTAYIIPLIMAYISMKIINWLFPHLIAFGNKIYDYTTDKTYDKINNMNYIQIFPLVMIVLVLFFILISK